MNALVNIDGSMFECLYIYLSIVIRINSDTFELHHHLIIVIIIIMDETYYKNEYIKYITTNRQYESYILKYK